MNLNQLQYFKILAQEEHYTRAAQMLSITQPSLATRSRSWKKNLAQGFLKKREEILCSHVMESCFFLMWRNL